MTASPTKLFVGGLSWGTIDSALFAEFSKFGHVEEATIVRDKITGRSRGFGFVRFGDPQKAHEAQKATDGQIFDGRPIRVDFASEKRRMAHPSDAPSSLYSMAPYAHYPGWQQPGQGAQYFNNMQPHYGYAQSNVSQYPGFMPYGAPTVQSPVSYYPEAMPVQFRHQPLEGHQYHDPSSSNTSQHHKEQ